MAMGRLMSLVGAGSQSMVLPMLSTSNRLQVKIKTKRVRARGTTFAPLGPIESLTCFWTASTAISHTSWNFPGTPLVALARSTRPMVITTSPAMTVAHTMSRLMVRPATLVVAWTPGVMSMPNSGALSRWNIGSGTARSIVGRPAHRRSGVSEVVVDDVGGDHVVDRGHRAGLGHRPGHVGQHDHLEHGQAGEDAEAELVGDGHQAEGDHGDDPQPTQGVDGQRAPLVLGFAGTDPGHRIADHPKVEGAQPEADAGTETEKRHAEGDTPDQSGHADHQHHGDGP